MHWILAISLLILFEIFADIFAKEYSLKQTVLFWALALGSYIIANVFWLVAINNGSELARGGYHLFCRISYRRHGCWTPDVW